MIDLLFVTPAHGRRALTAICLEQRRRVIDELASRYDLTARCLVIAEDENAATAEALGLDVLPRPNYELGRRFNDGIEHGCSWWRPRWVAPIGSDDWVLPEYCAALLGGRGVRSSGVLALVRQDGTELAVLDLDAEQNPYGYIPWLIPARLLMARGNRPCRDNRPTGIDAAIAKAVLYQRGAGYFTPTTFHDLQVVDFKSGAEQVTTYRRTVEVNPIRWSSRDPFERLAEVYPLDLVERVRDHYLGSDPA